MLQFALNILLTKHIKQNFAYWVTVLPELAGIFLTIIEIKSLLF